MMMVFMRMMMMMMLMMMVVTMMVTMEVNTWRCFDQRAPTTGCRRSSSPGRPINKNQKIFIIMIEFLIIIVMVMTVLP